MEFGFNFCVLEHMSVHVASRIILGMHYTCLQHCSRRADAGRGLSTELDVFEARQSIEEWHGVPSNVRGLKAKSRGGSSGKVCLEADVEIMEMSMWKQDQE